MDINTLLPDLFKEPAAPIGTDAKMGLLLPTELHQSNVISQDNLQADHDDQHATGKRVYYCQRCLNHGQREKRKNHKQECRFRACQCEKCFMVDQRRQLNTKMHQIQEGEYGLRSTNGNKTKNKERIPNCQHCAQHNKQNRLKGHKRACPYKDCSCGKCRVVKERQTLMAAQIKLRRQQKKLKEGGNQVHMEDRQVRPMEETDAHHRLMPSPSMIASQQPQSTPLLLRPLPPPPSLPQFAFPFAALQNGCHSGIHSLHPHGGGSMPCLSALQTFFHHLPQSHQIVPYMSVPLGNGFMDRDSWIQVSKKVEGKQTFNHDAKMDNDFTSMRLQASSCNRNCVDTSCLACWQERLKKK